MSNVNDFHTRIVELTNTAIEQLEGLHEMSGTDIRTLEIVNKVVTVLLEREKGIRVPDEFENLTDEELLARI